MITPLTCDLVAEPRLVSSAELARAVSVSPRTIQNWWAAGLITPDLVTAGGHARWNIERVRDRLRELHDPNRQARGSADPKGQQELGNRDD